ncbi:MAG: helix-turn-helix domain-containing GNAT family N-acetyltransferase [Bryobacteraceae bacterium]|jgi:DNA-binding MarR family transcriptional regulator/GNAT superfamily N-acetyltransferase
MPSADPAQIAAVRRFNRFYTRQIGLLRKSYLGSPYSLTEARVLYELAQRKDATAVELARSLDFDEGYLSRILARFEKRGLVSRTPSLYDRRQAHLSLTAKGRKAFAPLDGRSAGQSAAMLDPLRREDRPRLIEAMRTIETLLSPEATPPAPYTLRTHQPGDIGWIIHRHGALYAQEYGWGPLFEAVVAEIGAKFLREFDSSCERCWIAEKDGARVGSVLLMKASADTAQLRLLLVEPAARGLGIAKRLVEECIAFARANGYRKMTLWTHAELDAAQHIYAKAGFQMVGSLPPAHFGEPEPRQAWELSL